MEFKPAQDPSRMVAGMLGRCALLSAALFACSDPAEPGNDGGLASPGLSGYAPCALERRVGLFTLTLGDGFTGVEGRVAAAVVPANIREATATEGACRLMRGRTLFCDPVCGAGQTCGEGGACIPYPTAKSVGTVRMTGLKAALEMSPSSTNFYSNGATTLPHPAFDPGAAIALAASGGELGGFTLDGQGITALSAPETPIPLVRDTAAMVQWTAAGSGYARVRLVVDLAHHGGIAASLECDGLEDSGHFALPAALVTQLLDIGVAGFPTVSISRRTEDSADIAEGCVELAVVSEQVRDVSIAGLQSCSTDADCSGGATCQVDQTCR